MTPYYGTSYHNLQVAEGVIVAIYSKAAASDQSFLLGEVDMFNIVQKLVFLILLLFDESLCKDLQMCHS